MSKDIEKVLKECADRFHKVLASRKSQEILHKNGHKMAQVHYDAIAAKVMNWSAIDEILADGFEACVRALIDMGASDVSIHECRKEDIDGKES